MNKLMAFLGAFVLLACAQNTVSEDFVVPDGAFLAVNPLTYTDIPDNDVIRVGEDYYMVSTTMFFCPGAPIMHSRDMVHWRIVSYIYNLLEDDDIYSLKDGKNAYGAGQWATSLRYHKGVYYALFVSNDQQKSYLYRTADLVNGPWERTVFADYFFHDPGLLFDDDRLYVVYGNGDLKLAELAPDDSAVIGEPRVIIRAPKWRMGLRAEGCHFYKIGKYYYIVEIDWPRGGIRQATCWRSSRVEGPYKRKVVLKGTLDGRSGDGIAQGPIVDTPDGDWYAIQFQDHGAVGRIPTVQPVTWEDGWPVMGQAGKPMQLVAVKLPVDPAGDYVWASDEFSSDKLALVWQWNHKDPGDASLTERPGWLVLQAHPGDSLAQTLGTLTQRTVGPRCASEVLLDASGLGEGTEAGLCAFQSNSARIGVLREADGLVLVAREREKELWRQALPCAAPAGSLAGPSSVAGSSAGPSSGTTPAAVCCPVWLRIRYVFTPREPGDTPDTAFLSYSLDGSHWTELDYTLSMKYTLDYFTGYRSALYCMGPSGSAAFDYFHQWVY